MASTGGSSDPTANGEEAFAYLMTIGVPQAISGLLELQGFALDRGLDALRKGISFIIDGMLDDINRTAVEYAQLADGYIIAKIFETQSRNRPQGPGTLVDHIRSEPGPLGLVRVALLSELDKIVNEAGEYGPFWRAQEYGTGVGEGGFGGGGIPTQIDRVLFGTFEPAGLPPDAEQRGLGVGRDLAFVPQGANPGYGTITEDLPGRHFLRDGSNEAGERYVLRMNEIRDKWLNRCRTLVEGVQASGGSTLIFRSEA